MQRQQNVRKKVWDFPGLNWGRADRADLVAFHPQGWNTVIACWRSLERKGPVLGVVCMPGGWQGAQLEIKLLMLPTSPPFNISCLELYFSFFLPDFAFSCFSGFDPLFTRFLFFFDVEILCNLSNFLCSIPHLSCTHNRKDPSLCFFNVAFVNSIFLRTHLSVM